MNRLRSSAVALVLAAGSLSLGACATEKYVNQHVAVVDQKAQATQGQVDQQGQALQQHDARLAELDQATKEAMQRAEEANKAGDRARDVQAWEAANRNFHRIILAPCGMPRLLKAIDDLHTASARFLFSGWRAEWEAPTDRDHRTILDALRAGQTDMAVAVLGRHVQTIGQKKPR